MIDVDPALKRRLYAALGADGCSLKEWFLGRASDYLTHRGQTELFEQNRPSPDEAEEEGA
ncbi:MAG: hypothetical protein H6813_02765 [Phycisphaeraceae bacterium]|nr:hypothetical protein [Phycisphaeraceae bacterium]MCB9848761.1 hypothetical protein [Phycisphaeraceae bacterium]